MGTFADDPRHEVFHNILLAVTALDLLMQLYTVYLIMRVSATQMNRYRYFLLFSTVCRSDEYRSQLQRTLSNVAPLELGYLLHGYVGLRYAAACTSA